MGIDFVSDLISIVLQHFGGGPHVNLPSLRICAIHFKFSDIVFFHDAFLALEKCGAGPS